MGALGRKCARMEGCPTLGNQLGLFTVQVPDLVVHLHLNFTKVFMNILVELKLHFLPLGGIGKF